MTTKVCHTPAEVADWKWAMRATARGEPIMAPPPKPMMAMPVAMPGRSGNQVMRVFTGAT